MRKCDEFERQTKYEPEGQSSETAKLAIIKYAIKYTSIPAPFA